MEISFKGHRALVTGAGKGIGRALVKALYALGAEVVALSRTAEDLESLAQEVQQSTTTSLLPHLRLIYGLIQHSSQGTLQKKCIWDEVDDVAFGLTDQCPGVQTVCVDLEDWPATEAAVSSVGPVDLLVNNAGIAEQQSFLEMTQDSFDRHIAIHTRSIIPVSQIVARQIIARGVSGSIVNVSSQLSQSPMKNLGAYSTAKAAMDMLTKVMALELGSQKIRVNSVNPTLVMTRMAQEHFGSPEKASVFTSRIPLGRLAELDDVTNAIVFLLSDKSAMINGSRINVEGGFLI